MTPPEDHSDDSALAGEYVLHLLDAGERRAFDKRLVTEPQLRDLVRDWDAQLVILAQSIDPVSPPASVKIQLQKRLFPDRAPARHSVWQWMMGGLVAATLGVAVLMVLPSLGPDTSPAFTANIAAEDGSLVVLASFSAQTRTLDVSRQNGGAAPGRVLELWLIADGAAAPVSLGILSSDPDTRITVPPELAQQIMGGVLAISDEPPGGSPAAVPTGAVLAVGPVTDA